MRLWAIRLALLVGVFAVATVAVVGRPPGDVPVDGRAYDAGRRFLETYVARDGRVVRRDQGGDTVSEGQAYGMLIAVALADEDTFRRIWWWTRTHLQRSDGLLSHRWADGSVADPEPADDLRLRLTLDGHPAGDENHPLMLVAAAAAAHAAGDTPASVTQLLDEAEQLEQRHPSYYGAAWVALGRLWLDATAGSC